MANNALPRRTLADNAALARPSSGGEPGVPGLADALAGPQPSPIRRDRGILAPGVDEVPDTGVRREAEWSMLSDPVSPLPPERGHRDLTSGACFDLALRKPRDRPGRVDVRPDAA